MPTALDNGQRTPRKLLGSAVRWILTWGAKKPDARVTARPGSGQQVNQDSNAASNEDVLAPSGNRRRFEDPPNPPSLLKAEADAEASQPRSLASIQHAHYELLEGYIDVLTWKPKEIEVVRTGTSLRSRISAWAETPDAPTLGWERFLTRRLIRRHIRQKLREASVPYGYFRESERDPDTRDWFAQANESLRRFSETVRSKLSGRVKALGTFVLTLAVTIVTWIGFEDVREWAKDNGHAETTLYVAYSVWGGILLFAITIGPFIALFLIAGFSGKRELLLGSASDVILVQRKAENRGLRDGPNIYELETNLFLALNFPKKDEEQIDRIVFELFSWALIAIGLLVLIRGHWLAFLILLVISFIISFSALFLAHRRKCK